MATVLTMKDYKSDYQHLVVRYSGNKEKLYNEAVKLIDTWYSHIATICIEELEFRISKSLG